MNTRRLIGERRGGADAWGNQVLPLALLKGVAMSVNPGWLTYAEVRASVS